MTCKKITKRIGCFMIAAAMSSGSILSHDITSDAAKKVSINKKNAVVFIGKSITIKLNNAHKKAKIQWTATSGKYAVFAVNKKTRSKLEITGAKPGKFTVKATYKLGKYKKTFSCKVTVKKKTDKITTVDSKVTDNVSKIVNSPVATNAPNIPVPDKSIVSTTPTLRTTDMPIENPTNTPISIATGEPIVEATATPTITKEPTPTPKVICNFDFDEGKFDFKNGDVYGNNCTLELVEGMNSGYADDKDDTGSTSDGRCVKVSNRTGYWETAAFAYKIDKLDINTKYTISYDVYHDNGIAETYGTTNRVIITHVMDGYGQIGQPRAVFNGEWERISWDFTLKDIIDTSANNPNYIYLEFAYPEETNNDPNKAYHHKNIETYYIDNFSIKESLWVMPTPKPAIATTKPGTYPEGYVYKQRASEVQRWYKPGDFRGYHHTGYGNDSFAIWTVGFFDNEWSSDDEEVNAGIVGRELDDYKGKELSMGGEFWYDGDDQNTVLLQINYTAPDDYPMMIRWQDAKAPNGEADGLKIARSESSRDKVKSGYHEKFTISSFIIPSNAINGDKDELTGQNLPIYIYFANKPGGKLIYNKNNTFHFKNFWIKEK